jgi:hypothetical protein
VATLYLALFLLLGRVSVDTAYMMSPIDYTHTERQREGKEERERKRVLQHSKPRKADHFCQGHTGQSPESISEQT